MTNVTYTHTLLLPKTNFPMRVNRPHEQDLLETLGPNNGHVETLHPQFRLQDGPPYANGELHLGHMLNKMLKDFVVRSKRAQGQTVSFQPGWDCHGLPVEWQVELQWQAKKKDKKEHPKGFRANCRDHAQKWHQKQNRSFQKMGVAAAWDNPWTTMDNGFVSQTASNLLNLLHKGLVSHKTKVTLWSGVEKTVLAEAETEYHPRTARALWVKFPVSTKKHALSGVSLLVWTSMPWTLTVSQAVAYGAFEYALYHHETHGQLVVAKHQHQEAEKTLGALNFVKDVTPQDLDGLCVWHPLKQTHNHWDKTLPCLLGSHVEETSGSGFVHTAPAHGLDDAEFGVKNNLDFVDALNEDAQLCHMPVFEGLNVFEGTSSGPADTKVLDALTTTGHALSVQPYEHSYPHSWRSKMPLVWKSTPQWFLELDKHFDGGPTLRERAMAALDEMEWKPASGKSRLSTMVASRPDWVLSRQRGWGVPLPFFMHKTGPEKRQPLKDKRVDARLKNLFDRHGKEAWWDDELRNTALLGLYSPENFDPCKDVVDVWFESGCATHNLGQSQSDLALEGTDQHRGWFQASLLCHLALTGKPPFKTVMTHGFTLDAKGQKMSKSLGNTATPEDMSKELGVDGTRLWVALSDSDSDLRVSDASKRGAQDMQRKVRNTLRFMLGNLGDTLGEHKKLLSSNPALELSPLDRYVLHELAHTNALVREAYNTYDAGQAMRLTHQFFTRTLSNAYFDVKKDTLYCDDTSSPQRQSTLAVLSLCLNTSLAWLAPVMLLTVQEVLGVADALGIVPTFPSLEHLLDDDTKPMEQALKLRQQAQEKLSELDKETRPKFDNALWSYTGPLTKASLSSVLTHVVHSHGEEHTLTLQGQTPCTCPRCWQGTHTEGLCGRCESLVAQHL